MKPVFLKLNQISQGLMSWSAGISWFNELPVTEKEVVLRDLAFIASQAHPRVEDVGCAMNLAELEPSFTPCVLVSKALAPEKAFHKVLSLPEAEWQKSFRLLLGLLSVADARRRDTHCAMAALMSGIIYRDQIIGRMPLRPDGMSVMKLRLATVADIEAMHAIRLAVTENRLRDPRRATTQKYQEMLGKRGRGWVCEDEAGVIVGFGIADALSRSLWALFVRPGSERRGVGRALHDAMVEWLFSIDSRPIWLTTEPHTRAAGFYAAAGWTPQPSPVPGELCFSRLRA